MKKEIIEFLKTQIGTKVDHIEGFGAWLAGEIIKMTDDGDFELKFNIREEMLNPLGTIHGGAIAAILDEAMGMLVFLKSGQEDAFFALNISVDFVKNAKFGEQLIARPKLVRMGRKTANATCELFNESGQVVAHGSSNFLKLNN